MKHATALAAWTLAAWLPATSLPALAGAGHDHGEAAPAATGAALPRFVAVSESFELVGVLEGRQVVLYLDRYADNAPVRGASIELDIAGARFPAQARGDDTYEVLLKEAPKPGVLPVTATVTAGADTDLLAGELDLHAPADAGTADHDHHGHATAGTAAAGGAALGVLALLWAGGRRWRAARRERAGVAA